MRLDFLNPKFHKGLNSTVRRGIKSVSIGEQIELYETGKVVPEYKGEVTDIVVTSLGTIYVFPELIKYQHDIETQKLHGLLEAMGRFYPGIRSSEVVTIIYFYI